MYNIVKAVAWIVEVIFWGDIDDGVSLFYFKIQFS